MKDRRKGPGKKAGKSAGKGSKRKPGKPARKGPGKPTGGPRGRGGPGFNRPQRAPYNDPRAREGDLSRDRSRDRSRAKKSPGAHVVCGRHAVFALLQHAPGRVLKAFSWSTDSDAQEKMRRLCQAARVEVLPSPPDDRLAADHIAQGVALLVRPYPYADLDEVLDRTPAPLLLVLDSITDPRNLGAILRSAVFFGVTAVILPRDRASGVTGSVERIARGATATLPIVQVVNVARTVAALEERGISTFATVLDASAVPLQEANLSRPIAIVLGGEGRGVRPLVARRCSGALTLAPAGPMQSLNVASFASVVLAFCGRETDRSFG